MNRLILCISFFLPLLGFYSCHKDTDTQYVIDPNLITPDNISLIDYQVYNDFLNIQYADAKHVFILQKTDHVYWSAALLRFHYPPVDDSAITAYETNKDKISILDYRSFSPIVVLVPREETYDLLSQFYQKYPSANGLNTFSKIGFNRDSTQAIFGIAYRSLPEHDSDMTYLMQKENNHWVIKWSGGVMPD